ncbi:MAG TPA: SH3 domain-containing protein, partial [Asticcacaulis sp.]|nr:SH3 domain-containing protein [Asticcacaulis sp.]
MSTFSIRKTAAVSVALSALFSLAATEPVYAQAKASKAQQTQDKMMAGLPRCSAKLGTISVVNG